MNHDEAIQFEATERYLLDEMEEDARDAFEEHYFDCPVCANDVKAAFALRDAVHAAGAAKEATVIVQPERFGWRRFTVPLAAAASVMVTFFATWMGVVTPLRMQVAQAKLPHAAVEYSFEEYRSANERIVKNASTGAVLKIDIPADLGPAPYTCALLDARGQQLGKPFVVTAEQAKQLFLIEIPAGGLKPGDYGIRVSDANEKVIRDYPFTVP